MNTIQSVEYPGSIENFQAFMDRLNLLNNGKWIINSVEYHIRQEVYVKKGDMRIWNILRRTPKTENTDEEGDINPFTTRASIMATEITSQGTRVDFIDGTSAQSLRRPGTWEPDPLGRDFVDLMNIILSEWGTAENQAEIAGVELWERIPNVGWYREALRLWHEGYTTAEIGRRVRKDEQTVRNKISDLRRIHGEVIVPFRRR